MAAIASAIAALATCGLSCLQGIANCGKYIWNLESNLTALESVMDVLKPVYEDVNRRVMEAEREGWIRKTEVNSWLTTVEGLKKEVAGILADGNKMMERGCLCGLNPVNCYSLYSQSMLAMDKKAVVETELKQGHAFQTRDAFAVESEALISLKESLKELRNVYDTVKQRVQMEEQQEERVCTGEVSAWLRTVEDLLKEGNFQRQEGEQETARSPPVVDGEIVEDSLEGGSSQTQRNNMSSYGAWAAGQRTILVKELRIGREFEVFTLKPLMREKPLDISKVSNTDFERVLQWVQDEDGRVRRIGLWGMGGVGKTTLLTRIYNELLPVQRNYGVVAWMKVSRATNYKEEIQQALWKSLNLGHWDATAKMDTRAVEILNSMKNKRCLLFLDDIWQWDGKMLDLGIPSESKIIFTTRSKEVCGLLRCDRTEEVKCLPLEDALELLKDRVGEKIWSEPGIPELAKDLVEECKFLPLALVTVGATMSYRDDVDEWKRAVDLLRKGASHFEEMDKKVLSVLEFSYEALEDETRKKCFLYCSIFPEGYEFDKDQLVDLWIGAGFLESRGKISEQRDHGTEIRNHLRRACLLEDSTNKHGAESIRMHDLAREMGLWVASEHGKETNKVIVQHGLTSFEPSEVSKWEDAETISLWYPKGDEEIRNFPSMPRCSRLSTLIIRGSMLKTFPQGFFSRMPSLRILSLSWNLSLSKLPDDFGESLTELRYLNLDETAINEVPPSIKGMPNLVVLLVNPGCCVPAGLLSSLPSLRVFGIVRSLGERSSIAAHESALLDELRGMDGIEDVGLVLGSAECVRSVLTKEPRLQGCLRRLRLVECKDRGPLWISRQAVSQMKHLIDLSIKGCSFARVSIPYEGYVPAELNDRTPPLQDILQPSIPTEDPFRSLKNIAIGRCSGLVDVTVLIWYAPSLADLVIYGCSSMQELIARDVDDHDANRILSRLSKLRLSGLPKLKSICRRALPFPSLKYVEVFHCPNVKKLPFDRNSGAHDNSLEIRGKKEWAEGLEWEDQETKRLFSDKLFHTPGIVKFVMGRVDPQKRAKR